MAVRYDAKRQSWMFVIDLPAGPEGRRQMFLRGLKTEALAAREEKLCNAAVRQDRPRRGRKVAAELTQWLGERELDVAVTTLANCRNAVMKYVVPFLGGRQLYTIG